MQLCCGTALSFDSFPPGKCSSFPPGLYSSSYHNKGLPSTWSLQTPQIRDTSLSYGRKSPHSSSNVTNCTASACFWLSCHPVSHQSCLQPRARGAGMGGGWALGNWIKIKPKQNFVRIAWHKCQMGREGRRGEGEHSTPTRIPVQPLARMLTLAFWQCHRTSVGLPTWGRSTGLPLVA